MAGYFSNHSQSRFLANSNSNGNATATTTQTPSTVQPPTMHSRVPSKHFSTSVANTSGDEKAQAKDKAPGVLTSNGASEVHPLRNTWIFYFRQQRNPGNRITNYEEGINKVTAFSSVESFWSLWTHLHPPSTLQATTDYLLFHSGVRRPVWEDPLNLSGGKWIIRLKKGVSDRFWEDLVLAVIGDQFDECVPEHADVSEARKTEESGASEGGEWPEICGCTISVRGNEDIITVWHRVAGDQKVREKIQQTMRRVLHLPLTTVMEYKSNNDSMQDRSSFRVAAVDRTPLS